MRISVGAGTYIVAVSGGVDSMVLLDILRQRRDMKLVVAHFDHGIRNDSIQDRKLVQSFAKKHCLIFVYKNGNLGAGTSEAKARTARYGFLRSVQNASGAKAIITAHHQDDALETAVMNLMRGSGRRGLTSLKTTDGLVRPLLGHNKEQIREYALDHAVPWREDSSNQDVSYARNYIRANVIPKFSDGQRAQFVILLEELRTINDELDNRMVGLLHTQPATNVLDRAWFIHLPHEVAKDVLHTWLRQHGVKDVTKKTIERLIVAMKTGHGGQKIDVDSQYQLQINKYSLALRARER